jgi:fibronectin type 3 domain-containing protein
MKNLKMIFAGLAVVLVVLAGCEQPAGDEPKPEEKTTVTIRNECFSDLIDVKWSGTMFADNNNTLSISSAVTKQVEAGEAYIYFSRQSNPVVARTKELFVIEKGEHLTFRFYDNTLIVEASNPDNTGSLKDLISRLLTPSKPLLSAQNGTIEASWDAVEGASSYRVYVGETDTPPEEALKTVTETAAVITGLTNEKTYYVWLQAVNARSESDLSPAAHKTLTLGVPVSPTLTAGNGSITASWAGVDMATSYKVYISNTTTPPEEASKTLTETSTVFTGLSNNTPYHVWVQAVNAGGSSNLGGRAQLTLTLAVPQGISLTAGNGSFTVNWTATALTDSYKVYYNTVSTLPAEAEKIVAETNTAITGLTNGTTYYVWVQAVNSGGESALSLPVQKELILAAPQNVSLTPGNGKITVQWGAVSSASSYKVYYGVSTTQPAEAAQTVTGTTIALDGLTNSTTYYVWVQAVNSGGGGTVSDRVQLTLTLAAPQSISLTQGNGKITVQWGAVTLADSYKVYYSTTTTRPQDAAQSDLTGTSVAITGLSNGTSYYVWVQAVNSGGGGTVSDRAQLTLTLAAPQNVILTQGNGKITAEWSAVTLADSYKVYYGTTTTRPEEAAQSDLTGTSAAITGLSNGTTYYIWVQAVNSGGGGTVSDRGQLTLTLEPPQSITLSAGDGSLTASWEAVTLADSYKVYVSETSTRPEEAAQTATGTSAVVSGLSNNATYHVWVQAVNTGGDGTVSDRVQVFLPVHYTVANSGELASAIASINAAGAGEYAITLAASITTGPITFNDSASKTIAVKANSSRSLTNSGGAALVTVPGSITLIQDRNITLNGNSKSYPVVNVLSGGTFVMNDGSTVMGASVTVTGTGSVSITGGGVISRGTFIMNGGDIISNSTSATTTSYYNSYSYGGGVSIEGGTFTMKGGTISGNTSTAITSTNNHTSDRPYSYGGGVYIKSGTFTMIDGTISGNSVSSFIPVNTSHYSYGGGVCIEGGIFTMSGGTISANSAFTTGTYGGGTSYGGGVYVLGGIFTKTGGTIDNTNSAGYGNVAYVSNGNKKRNTTAGPDVTMNSNTAGSAGGWE